MNGYYLSTDTNLEYLFNVQIWNTTVSLHNDLGGNRALTAQRIDRHDTALHLQELQQLGTPPAWRQTENELAYYPR